MHEYIASQCQFSHCHCEMRFYRLICLKLQNEIYMLLPYRKPVHKWKTQWGKYHAFICSHLRIIFMFLYLYYILILHIFYIYVNQYIYIIYIFFCYNVILRHQHKILQLLYKIRYSKTRATQHKSGHTEDTMGYWSSQTEWEPEAPCCQILLILL